MKTHEENTSMDSIARQYVCDCCGRTNFVDGHALEDHKKHCNNKKQCTKCKQTKASTEFWKSTRYGLQFRCKVCCRAVNEQKKYNPDYTKTKQCTKCKQTKASTEFWKQCRSRSGLQSRCKVCRQAVNEQNKCKPVYSKTKQCTKCKQTKDSTEFSKNSRMRDELESLCKVCRRKKNRESRMNKKRENTIARQYVCDRCGLGADPCFGVLAHALLKKVSLPVQAHCKVCRQAGNEQNKCKPDYSEMKQCTKCKQTKASTEFWKSTRDGLESQCKVCRMNKMREYNKLRMNKKRKYNEGRERAERKLNGCGPKRKRSASAGNGLESARHLDPSLEATVNEGGGYLHGITNSIELQYQRDTLIQTITELQHQRDTLLVQTITELQHQVPFATVENKPKYSYWV